MALLTTLLGALSRKLGDFLQAIFGWSVAALFGRLNGKTQVLVTLALVLALCWPVFVVGVFFPAAATFLIAFVPIESEVLRSVLRVVWTVLAVAAPLVVALCVRTALPLRARRPLAITLMNGYPLSFGMALSFLVTLVTVPLIKLMSMSRRWEDQHLYVQPRAHRYDDVLRHLVTACEAAGYEPRVEAVPVQMSLSIRVLRFFSRGAIDALIIEKPQRVCCDGLELYLYPADLLLRGKPNFVAQVRARLTATFLERDAWLVRDAAAQQMQDDLGRLWDVLHAHEFPAEAAHGVRARLEGIVRESWSAKKLTFDDWLTLDRIARRLETALSGHRSLIDELAGAAQVTPAAAPVELNGSLPSLVRSLAHESRELVKLEASLAKVEAEELAAGAQRSVIVLGAAVAVAGAALGVGGVAAVLAFGASPLVALGVAGGLAGVALIVGLVGYAAVPKQPMERTKHRLERDWRLIKERAA